MKDYVYIYNEDGVEIKMEAVLAFKLEKSEEQYLLYKEEGNTSEVYVAKIKPHSNPLDTNLTEEEKNMVKKVLEQQLKEIKDGN